MQEEKIMNPMIIKNQYENITKKQLHCIVFCDIIYKAEKQYTHQGEGRHVLNWGGI